MKLLGMTVGPIHDTLALATTPAMLWYSSAVFSRLTFLLCQELWCSIPQIQLLSPAIPPEVLETEGYAPDGIGKYHDRILCKIPDHAVSLLDGIVVRAKSRLAEMISQDKNGEATQKDLDFLARYLQVHYVLLEDSPDAGKGLLTSSLHLDALEQMRTFDPDNTDNVFLNFFDKAHFRNSQIKQCAMLRKVNASQLLNRDGSFRAITQIARSGSHTSTGSCYAVIQADGDRMGAYLKTLETDAQIRDFSQGCLDFAAAASKLIGNFGGMTVYAGGDDLLALTPVQSTNGQTVLKLCSQLQACFDQIIRKGGDGPTLSIGISVRYEKFPLYESLNAAGTALNAIAKSTPGKSCVALDWQKHSGQSICLCIPTEHLGYVNSLMETGDGLESANSVIYILDTFQSVLAVEKHDPLRIRTVFSNLYDNAGQSRFLPYVQAVAEQFNQLVAQPERRVQTFQWEGDRDIQTLESLLRLKRYLTEEGSI